MVDIIKDYLVNNGMDRHYADKMVVQDKKNYRSEVGWTPFPVKIGPFAHANRNYDKAIAALYALTADSKVCLNHRGDGSIWVNGRQEDIEMAFRNAT